MERWDCVRKEMVERKDVDAFLAEIIEVGKKHNLFLSHEDTHGSFEVVPFEKADTGWVLEADVNDRGLR